MQFKKNKNKNKNTFPTADISNCHFLYGLILKQGKIQSLQSKVCTFFWAEISGRSKNSKER